MLPRMAVPTRRDGATLAKYFSPRCFLAKPVRCAARPPSATQMIPCRFFLSGACKRGEACAFSHDPDVCARAVAPGVAEGGACAHSGDGVRTGVESARGGAASSGAGFSKTKGVCKDGKERGAPRLGDASATLRGAGRSGTSAVSVDAASGQLTNPGCNQAAYKRLRKTESEMRAVASATAVSPFSSASAPSLFKARGRGEDSASTNHITEQDGVASYGMEVATDVSAPSDDSRETHGVTPSKPASATSTSRLFISPFGDL